MNSQSSDLLFPLPNRRLPRVDIDPQTVAKWTAEALDGVSDVLMNRSSWYYRFDESDPSFTRGYDKNGTRGCMRVLPGSTNVEYLSRGELHMTMGDVVYAMTCETTEQQRSLFAQLYQDVCLDTAVLQRFESATTDDPFRSAAMIWFVLHPDMWAPHDYLYFETSFTTVDDNGKTVLVQYRKSHDLWPHQLTKDHSLPIARKHTFSITTFCIESPGRVVMTAMGRLAFESKFSTWFFKRAMPSVYKQTLNHHGVIDTKNLQRIGITADTLCEQSPVHESICRVCRKGFGVTRRRKWCRRCGHSMCRDCNMKVTLLKSGVLQGPRLPFVRARFCLRCLLHASEQRIKSDLQRELIKTPGGESTPSWWEDVTTEDGSLMDGLLDIQREDCELQKSSVGETDASFSTTDSEAEDEHSLAKAIAKADELTLFAAFVAEKTAQLRLIHQQRYLEHQP